MQTVPFVRNAPPRHASPLRETAPHAATDLGEGDRFVPAATCLAVVVTVVLIFFGRW